MESGKSLSENARLKKRSMRSHSSGVRLGLQKARQFSSMRIQWPRMGEIKLTELSSDQRESRREFWRGKRKL